MKGLDPVAATQDDQNDAEGYRHSFYHAFLYNFLVSLCSGCIQKYGKINMLDRNHYTFTINHHAFYYGLFVNTIFRKVKKKKKNLVEILSIISA